MENQPKLWNFSSSAADASRQNMAQSIKLLIQTSASAKNWSIALVAGVCSCSQYLVGQSATFGTRAIEQAPPRPLFGRQATRTLVSGPERSPAQISCGGSPHGLSEF